MEILFLLSIILGTVLYVVMPFLRKRTRLTGDGIPSTRRLDRLYARRDNLLSDIKDLEFDREMGKVSEKDFADISARYRREAVSVLKDIDFMQRGDGPQSSSEFEEVGRESCCPQCGASVGLEDRFCRQCGNLLDESSR